MEVTEADRTRVPLKTVLASIAGLWLCYFVLTTLRSEVFGFGFPLEMMWRRAIACLAGIVITAMLWLILRLFDSRPLWMKIIAALVVSVPAAVLLVQSNKAVFADIEDEAAQNMAASQEGAGTDPLGSGTASGEESPEVVVKQVTMTPLQALVDEAFGRYFMMLAWCALYLALLTGEKARAAERREGTYKRAAKAAELRSLRYQVNPHFLFNTLNSLSALVLTGKTQAAERMIQTISTFYRRSLADDPTIDVPLREEFALQKLYLDIEATRFPHRLRAVYTLPEGLEDAKVPGMILQPLVENSVKHAVAPTGEQVTITLAAREEYGRLVVTVTDDGPGAAGGEGERRAQAVLGHGIGVANVRDRLEARFGSEATIVSGPVPGGYSTQLRMPILRQTDPA
jgi:signal transduction histidine kinase